MTHIGVRKQHDVAWQQLFELVQQRNTLLRQLGAMASFAADFSPATAMFMEFDFDQAQAILAKVQAMMPGIDKAIAKVNVYAAQIGKPKIERKSLMPRA
jgi:hypothetical protein